MVILHIISGGEVGGSKNHILSLLSSMKNNNLKNILICFLNGTLYQEALSLGIDVRLIPQNKRFDLRIINEIQKICIEEKVDIINCHGARANFIAYFLKKKYNAKYVSTIHSDYKDDYKGSFYKTLIYSNLNRICLKNFDYYIAVSDSFKDMLIKRGFKEDKIFVVYNGIDFYRNPQIFNKDEIIKKYNLPKANHYITMIARFHPVKGHKFFLKTCSKVLKVFNDVIFILVGDGILKEELIEYVKELKIQDKIVFTGFQKPDEFIYISDFTVLTSYTESFPLTILESAFYKKTVISTDVGGISKLIEDGKNGYLIKTNDEEKLFNCMIDLLNNNDKTKILGDNLYNKASKNFSIKNLVENYEKIYKTILHGGL